MEQLTTTNDALSVPKGYKQTEVGVIPEDWDLIELGEVGQFKNGINKSKEDFGFGFPFVNLLDVFGKPKIYGNEVFDLINSNEAERSLYNLKKGDVLFIRSSVKPSGVGLTSVIASDLKDTVFSGFLIRFREGIGIYTDFKKYCFHNEKFRNELIANSSVSANTNINQDALKKLKLVLPPVEEQKAIAQVLSDTDALLQALEKKIAKKKGIKKGVMQELLTPKEGWVEKRLGEIFTFYSTSNFSKAEMSLEGEVGCIHYGLIHAVNNTSYSLSGGVKYYVTKKEAKYETIQEGDIIMVDASEDLTGLNKSVEVVDLKNQEYIAGLHTFHLRDKNSIYVKYFRGLILNSAKVKKQMLRLAVGMKVFGVSKPKLQQILLPVPQIEEQTHIAQILSDMDQEIENLEQKLSKYQLAKQGMMQQLLTGKIRLV